MILSYYKPILENSIPKTTKKLILGGKFNYSVDNFYRTN